MWFEFFQPFVIYQMFYSLDFAYILFLNSFLCICVSFPCRPPYKAAASSWLLTHTLNTVFISFLSVEAKFSLSLRMRFFQCGPRSLSFHLRFLLVLELCCCPAGPWKVEPVWHKSSQDSLVQCYLNCIPPGSLYPAIYQD